MATSHSYYIGIMSGTSLDAIDAALISFQNSSLSIVDTHSIEIDNSLRQDIEALCRAGDNEIDRSAQLDRRLGVLFAQCTQALLKKTSLRPSDVIAIGSHGQTVRHQPHGTYPYTVQIGDPNTIAHLTQISTVADFRRRDIAAGGQGAPLVPVFHEYAFNAADKQRVIVNIGGMSNISLLTHDQNHMLGFDTGPGNVLLNTWIEQHQNKTYDKDGIWAKSGKLNQALLDSFLSDPYFQLAPPKSTGRERFNKAWLNQFDTSTLPAEDVQTTLTHLTTQCISQAILKYASACEEVIVCGGGALNVFLMEVLRQQLPNISVSASDAFGIDSQWVEAAAFAWLAKQTIERKTSNNPTVTGASQAVILGGVYYA